MKRLLLLAAVLGMTSTAFAQVPKRVLLEEFTNTGCPPCAATDPTVEAFEAENLPNLAVLKYHVSWPDPNDPFYIAQKTLNQSDLRVFNLYAQNGVPCFFVNGELAAWSTYAQVGPSLQTRLDAELAETSPFEVHVSHVIEEGNKVHGTVTVKCVGDLPAETDLRLAFVIAERWNPFLGSNGRPFHSSIVRKVMPGIGQDGAISEEGALTIAKGETKTFEFTQAIGSTWTKDQLMSVAFIQSASSKKVYQSDWTVPTVKVTAESGTVIIPALGGSQITLQNMAATEVKVKANMVGDVPGSWTATVDGATNGVITLAPNETKNVTLNVSAPDGAAYGYSQMNVFLNSVNNAGDAISGIGGASQLYFGRDNKNVLVDGGAGVTELGTVVSSMKADGLQKIGVIDLAAFNQNFPDWSGFDHVYMGTGLSAGLFSDDGSFDRVTEYLNQGGKFVYAGYVGPGIYYNAFDQTGDEAYLDMWRNSMGIEPMGVYKKVSWTSLKSIANDPISGGLTMSLATAGSYRSPVKPVAGSRTYSIFNSAADTVGLRGFIGDNNGKFVYLGFGLEDMTAANRDKLTEKIYTWLDANASVKKSDAAENVSLANYPNPFNPSTTIEFSVTETSPVTLVVRDMMGSEVATLIDLQMHTPGTYTQNFDASKLASGTYMYELTVGSQKITKMMTLNK